MRSLFFESEKRKRKMEEKWEQFRFIFDENILGIIDRKIPFSCFLTLKSVHEIQVCHFVYFS